MEDNAEWGEGGSLAFEYKVKAMLPRTCQHAPCSFGSWSQ